MTDSNLAKKTLEAKSLAVCVVLHAKVVYTSTDYGIKPLYLAYKQGYNFSQCSGADKVVGLGAAVFWAKMHIDHLHTRLLSAPALDFLTEQNIAITYDKLVPRIKNRAGDGYCPVETIATEADNFDEFLTNTEAFLKSLGLI